MSLLYIFYLSRIEFGTRIGEYFKVLLKTQDLWSTPIPPLSDIDLWRRANLREIFETSLFHLPYIFYFFAVFHVAFKWFCGKSDLLDAFVIVTALFGFFSYGLLIFRAGFDALFRILPPFYLLLGFYTSRLDIFSTRFINKLAPPKGLAGKLLLFYKAILLSLFPLYFIFNMTWNNGFYSGSIGAIRENPMPLQMDRVSLYVPEFEYGVVKEITEFIKENTSKEDYILAVPFNPIWYFLTDRKNPSYYEWVLPGMLRSDKEQEGLVRELGQNPPKYIVYADVAIDGMEERRFSNYASKIEAFIRASYFPVKKVKFFEILKFWPLSRPVSNTKPLGF